MSKNAQSLVFTGLIGGLTALLAWAAASAWPYRFDAATLWLAPILAGLVAVAGRFPFKVSPQGDATVVTVPLLAASLLLHPLMAFCVALAGTLLSEASLRARPRVLVFNVAANSLVVLLAASLFWALTGGPLRSAFTASYAAKAVAAGLVLFISNLALLFSMITIVKGSGFWQRWRDAWSLQALMDASLLFFGLLGVQLISLAWWWAIIIVVPFVATYLGYRRSVQQAVDKTILAEELEQNLRQLKETQAQLVQSAKLAGIGTLAAGLAHEINNPLTIITGRAELFLAKLKRSPDYAASEQAARDVEDIKQMGNRISTIMKQLLAYSRRSEYVTDVRLDQVIGDSVQLLNGRIEKKGVRLVTDYRGPVRVRGVANQLQQVFVNLLSNAIDAVPDWGEVSVGYATQDGVVMAYVKDTGVGIPPEVREHIFEPFFTTKEMGKGTGLGLYICHKIVSEHDGSIHLESAVGQGTTVSVTFPVVPAAAKESREGITAA